MRTSQGKLAALAFILMLAAILILPMNVAREDSIVLSPARMRMSPGRSYVLKCLLSSDNPNQTIRYTSSNPNVASIAGDGTVTALSSGEAIITVQASGGCTSECKVVVTGIPLDELSLNTNELHISRGQYSDLMLTYNTNASDRRLNWESADPAIATVDETGRVLGISGGRTKVTVTASNGKSTSCEVCVDVPSTAVNITPADMIVGVGARIALNVSFMPEDSTDYVQSWVISNPNVLSVDADGIMTALAEGTVHVSALTGDGRTAGIKVMVESAPRDMEINPTRATIKCGDQLKMQLLTMDETGTMSESRHPTVWTSADTSVARIDSEGMVTAISDGVTRITASSDGHTVSGYITVRTFADEVIVEPSEVYLLREETGNPIQMRCKVLPEIVYEPGLTFESNNTQVANVSETGLVTMTGGYGTAVITATAEGGAFATLTVNVVTELPKATEEPVIENEPYIEESVEEDTYVAPEIVIPVVDEIPDTDEGFFEDDFDLSDDSDEIPWTFNEDGFAIDEYGEVIYDEYGEPITR